MQWSAPKYRRPARFTATGSEAFCSDYEGRDVVITVQLDIVRDFFFQAEDGIRVIGVTAVQTCALPILGARDFPKVSNVPDWRDVSPRLGMAWDLFGDGKTAVKASLGRYTISMAGSIARAVAPIITSDRKSVV